MSDTHLKEIDAFWHPLPVGDKKPLPRLQAVPLCPESPWPPPREKWQKIPPRQQLGIDIPDDPELIRWALSQAAKTVPRRSITPAPACGMTVEEREFHANHCAVIAAKAERAFIAELNAHARAYLTAFCELRKGGRL